MTSLVQKVLLFLLVLLTGLVAAPQVSVALLPFTSEVASNQYTQALSVFEVSAENCREALVTELVRNTSLKVLERDNLKKILQEQSYQTTGLTDETETLKLGKLLNLKYIVKGKIFQNTLNAVLSVTVFSVETGEVITSERIEGLLGRELIVKTKALAKQLEKSIFEKEQQGTLSQNNSPEAKPHDPVSSNNEGGLSLSVKSSSNSGLSTEKGNLTLIQFAFLNPLQIFPASFDVLGFSLGMILSENKNVYGLNTSLISIVKEDSLGFQTGFICVSGKLFGAQASFINVNSLMEGAQVGFINKSDDFVGAQTGFINVARIVRGAQVGFLNFAERLYGAQVGFLNFVSRGPGVPVMLGLNIGF